MNLFSVLDQHLPQFKINPTKPYLETRRWGNTEKHPLATSILKYAQILDKTANNGRKF